MLSYKTIVLLLITLAFPLLGNAASENPMAFQVIRPCHGTAGHCMPFLLANGYIEQDTYIKLDEYLKKTGWIPTKSSTTKEFTPEQMKAAEKYSRYNGEPLVEIDKKKKYEQPKDYDEIFEEVGKEIGVDPKLLKAIAKIESNFRADARGPENDTICFNSSGGGSLWRYKTWSVYSINRI